MCALVTGVQTCALPISRTRLRNVLAPGTTRIDYIYDFGDYWEHELTVSDVRAGDPVTAYPRFIAGERDCPPEDCGGISGFYEMLEAKADPPHPEHADISEWLAGYDPDALEIGRASCRERVCQYV